METAALIFLNISKEQCDILIAELSTVGFTGFEEMEDSLKAYIPAESFFEEDIKEICLSLNCSYHKEMIAETNWNALWESNFSPVIVDDFAGIRAHFHPPIANVHHEILITPKMSFGTGHHATTHLMIQQMRQLFFTGKQVFDFGTGTGVLAILAEKLGADNVLAIDNDDWSIDNTNENVEKNNCKRIIIQKANDAHTGQLFHIILANINKNVLLDNMTALNQQLLADGQLLISGLLIEDEEALKKAAEDEGLHFQQTWQRNGWICMQFSK
jgi:ribosomal protein L11 methyltransferase